MDLYAVLGVDPGSAPADIRRAYLRLARRYHPDAHMDDAPPARAEAERRMREVNAAWQVLGDTEARRNYDLGIPDGADLPPAEPVVRRPSGPGWRPRADDTGWMDDFEEWRQEVDDVVPPERPVTAARSSLTLLPAAVGAAGVVFGMLGLVMSVRPLIAVGMVGLIASALLFVFVPLLLMLNDQDR